MLMARVMKNFGQYERWYACCRGLRIYSTWSRYISSDMPPTKPIAVLMPRICDSASNTSLMMMTVVMASTMYSIRSV